jgi:ubiquitin-protein ligase
MPEFDDIHCLHGAIFVRRGLYRDGIFRFRMALPPLYNTANTHPQIFFTPPLFNPLVDPSTGALDLSVEESLGTWSPDKHFLVTALTFLKRIFYMKEWEDFSRIANPEAKHM